jgi:hypothetical protein
VEVPSLGQPALLATTMFPWLVTVMGHPTHDALDLGREYVFGGMLGH